MVSLSSPFLFLKMLLIFSLFLHQFVYWNFEAPNILKYLCLLHVNYRDVCLTQIYEDGSIHFGMYPASEENLFFSIDTLMKMNCGIIGFLKSIYLLTNTG